MRINDFIDLSSRALITKTSRTLLTILGMGVGIGAVLMLVSLGFGLRNVLIEEITTDKSFVILDVTTKDSDILTLTKGSLKSIKNTEGVKEVSPVQEFSAQATFGKLKSEVSVLSVKASFFELSGLDADISKGRSFKSNEQQQIVITESLAQLFDSNGVSNIGKSVTIDVALDDVNFDDAPAVATSSDDAEFIPNEMQHFVRDFKVIGILEGHMESAIYLHEKNLNQYSNEYSLVKVETTTSDILQAVRTKILDMGFAVSTISDTVEQANKIFKVITTVLAVFGIIALIVSAIGMFNTMTITLLERTQEIGVMKSIGASKVDISKLFITEATMMGFLGSMAGVLMGLGASEIINAGFNTVALRMGGEAVDIFYAPPQFVIFIMLFGTIIGLITGIFPARRAGKIDALEALRYK